ncbi:MAG: NAD(P)/FAD-dependent oxidoreductase [Gammaproteobacteria bacterium]|nr:NAD(P)/FAD-dependent oxidoreductase [Gammaproteobacteria bacterium]MYF03021.1 NAD(P)/FAD-dependent oxidoreductase [Gammaproteobacteria bacterium]MYI77212.1 NAD(P)/FAD-dependent oxidoreductase [Gammaproteobacteria bacterium]
MSANDDVVILGAGHNGLVCACYLAMSGLKVRILERRNVVGGACVTEEFCPGFRNSTASYTVGLLDSEIIQDLKLFQHGLRIVPRPLANFFPLSDEESLSIYNNPKDTQQEFNRFSRNDATVLPKFQAMVREIGDVVIPQMHRTPPNKGTGIHGWIQTLETTRRVMRLSTQRRRDLTKLFLSSISDLVRSWFENPHIQAAIAFDAVVGNFASLHSSGTAYGLLHHAIGEIASQRGVWGHPIGGMGAITQAMLKQAEDLGVAVETNADVVEVCIENGIATGAVLADGSMRSAKAIVANLAPQQLYSDLVDRSILDGDFVKSIENLQSESAVLRINLALSELPQFVCKPSDEIQEHHQSGIVFGPTLDYMESAYLDARTKDWSREPVIEMLIPSTVDDSLAPPGQHVASLFCQYFPYERDWDKDRERAADTVFKTIDQYAPNFSGSVIDRQVLTPLDLECKFGLPRGDIFHLSHTPSQLWVNRPIFGHAAYRGPVSRLYHCGAGSHPGGGVSGIPGKNAAKQVLKDL